MKYAYIGIRSLTYAQRAVKLLDQARLRAYMVRTPMIAGEQSCAYSVKLRDRDLQAALAVLQAAGLETGKLYLQAEDGTVTPLPQPRAERRAGI